MRWPRSRPIRRAPTRRAPIRPAPIRGAPIRGAPISGAPIRGARGRRARRRRRPEGRRPALWISVDPMEPIRAPRDPSPPSGRWPSARGRLRRRVWRSALPSRRRALRPRSASAPWPRVGSSSFARRPSPAWRWCSWRAARWRARAASLRSTLQRSGSRTAWPFPSEPSSPLACAPPPSAHRRRSRSAEDGWTAHGCSCASLAGSTCRRWESGPSWRCAGGCGR